MEKLEQRQQLALSSRVALLARGIAEAFRAPISSSHLPLRVLELVRAQDRAAERLIIYVQLSLATAFAVLYVLAPRPGDAAMSMFAPVPYALAAYTIFTLFRFGMSRHGPLPGRFVIPS